MSISEEGHGLIELNPTPQLLQQILAEPRRLNGALGATPPAREIMSISQAVEWQECVFRSGHALARIPVVKTSWKCKGETLVQNA